MNFAIPILQQPRSCHRLDGTTLTSSCSQTCKVTPWTSKPWRTSNAAATELSTPPLIPSKTVGPVMGCYCTGEREEGLAADCGLVYRDRESRLALFRTRQFLLPVICPHVAHSMEVGPFLDRNEWGANVSDEDSWLEDLNLFVRCDRPVDLPAIHQDSG